MVRQRNLHNEALTLPRFVVGSIRGILFPYSCKHLNNAYVNKVHPNYEVGLPLLVTGRKFYDSMRAWDSINEIGFSLNFNLSTIWAEVSNIYIRSPAVFTIPKRSAGAK